MTLRDRLQWVFRMSLMAFILASVAFLSALTAVRFAIQGREVAMPDVVGKKAVEAQQILQSRGVGIKVEDHIYNSLPVDTVVRQSPGAGFARKDRTVRARDAEPGPAKSHDSLAGGT